MHHEFAVQGGLQVEFDAVAVVPARGRRGAKRANGVLSGAARCTTMSDHNWCSLRCGKRWGSHVDPLLIEWKLVDVTGHINIVDNEMCTLFTSVAERSIAADRQRPGPSAGPGSLRPFDTLLTNRALPRHAKEHR
jgi:hypothetical protein